MADTKHICVGAIDVTLHVISLLRSSSGDSNSFYCRRTAAGQDSFFVDAIKEPYVPLEGHVVPRLKSAVP